MTTNKLQRALLVVFSLLTALLLLLVVLVSAAMNPAYVAPSPNDGDLVNGTQVLNVTFYGTANITVSWNNNSNSGWVDLCAVDSSAAWQNCTWDTSQLVDTRNVTINTTVTNNTDGGDATTVLITDLIVDNNAPSVTLGVPADSSSFIGPSVFFNWTVTDTIDLNVTCELYLSVGSGYSLNTTLDNSTQNLTLNFSDDYTGAQWYLNCTDDVPFRTVASPNQFAVDVPVDPSFITPSPVDYNNLSGTVTINFTYSDLADFDVYYFDGASWSTSIPGCTGNNLAPPFDCTWNTATATDGNQYILNLSIEDYNNNTDTAQITIDGLTVDNTAPSVASGVPANNDIFNQSDIFFNWTVTDSVDTNVTCHLYINSGSGYYLNSTFGNETNNHTLNFTDGVHNWYMNCTDYTGEEIGRYATTAARAFTVDVVVPSFTNIRITPQSYDNFTNATPQLNLTISEQGTLDTCEYSDDMGVTWSPLTIAVSQCLGTIGSYTDGDQINLTFRINDTAGNRRTYNGTYNLTVDTVPPFINITNPANETEYTRGSVFLLNATVFENGANITNGIACSVTLAGSSLDINGTVLYSSTTNTCQGAVEINQSTALAEYEDLAISITDRVNNTNTSTISIYVDTLSPVLVGNITTNLTNYVADNDSQVFWIAARYYDFGGFSSAFVQNSTRQQMNNQSPLASTFVTFNLTVNASTLGCPAVGLCPVRVDVNDSWGNAESDAQNIVIDKNPPFYAAYGTNASGTTLFTDDTLIYAQWSDESLSTPVATNAVLYKYRNALPVAVDSIALNQNLLWSNFTYRINATEDEGQELTFFINYTDLRGFMNSTPNITVTFENRSPHIIAFAHLYLTQNITTENPVFSLRLADEGKGFTSGLINLSFTNGAQNLSTVYPHAKYSCVEQDVLAEQILALNGNLLFNLSYTGITEYNITVVAINYTNASTDAVIVRRDDWYAANGINTSWLEVGASEQIGALGITVNSVFNESGTLKANLTFTDRDYEELLCNFTQSTDLQEGWFRTTLNVRDAMNNTNASTIDWTVDGARPVFINISLGSSQPVRDGTVLRGVVNLTQTSTSFPINWSINESNHNRTRVFVDDRLVLTDPTGAIINTTLLDLEPGHHTLSVQAADATFAGNGQWTIQNFTLFFNPLTDFSASYQNLAGSINTSLGGSLQNFSIFREGVLLNNNPATRVNGSMRFTYAFNLSTLDLTLNTWAMDGLRFNWNNTNVEFTTDNTSALALEVRTNTGIDTDYLALVQNYSRPTDPEHARFYSGNYSGQPANWTFTLSEEKYIILFGDEDGESFYLLEECSSNPGQGVTFDTACYQNASLNYTVFAPAVTGLAIGGDSQAPNITHHLPYDGQVINDSYYTLNFSVIEPAPNTTAFCTYTLLIGNESQTSETLGVDSFITRGPRRFYNETLINQSDSGVWLLNVSCKDTGGRSHNLQSNFTIADTTAPTILTITESDPTTEQVTITATANELAQFSIEYGTSYANLTSSTGSTGFGFSGEVTVNGLLPNTRYYYRVVACDDKSQCTKSPPEPTFPATFRTAEQESGRLGGGGGGGGAAIVEGMVIASDYHGWASLPAGWLRYPLDIVDMPVSAIGILLDNATNNPYVEVKAYFGKPRNVPVAEFLPYQYFQIATNKIREHASEYELEFRIPESWLTNVSADVDDVHFYRLEQGNWTEYDERHTETDNGWEYFEVDLPGFSFFAITVEGVLPTVNNWTLPVTPGLGDGQPLNTTPSPGSGDDGGITGAITDAVDDAIGEVVGYDPDLPSIWWFILPVIIVVLVVGGGAYYYKKRMAPGAMAMVAQTELLETDPLYGLQVYINKALNAGHSSAEIQQKLVSVGWDEIIVDEEIGKMMGKRI